MTVDKRTELPSVASERADSRSGPHAEAAGTLFWDGEMGERIRAMDWSQTPLGPIESWPPSLKTAVGIMLSASSPIGIYWGVDLITLYNDAGRVLIGEKHPRALGRPAREVFPEIWETIESIFVGVMSGQGVAEVRNQLLPVDRHGRIEGAWFDYSLNPIPCADGSIGGILNIAVETTDRVRAKEALRQSEQELAAELDVARRLQQVSMQLIQADDIETLYDQILDTAMATLHADLASIQRFHPERGAEGELELLGHRGFSAQAARFWKWVRPASTSSCSMALRTGTRVTVPDVQTCDFMAGSADLETCLRTGIRAVQTTPLVSRSGTLLGMFSTHWREPHELTSSELHALDVLARQAADLIDRKQAEEARCASEERFRLLVEQAVDGIFVIGAQGHYIDVNSAGCQMLGYSREEVLSRGIADVVAAEDVPRIAPEVARFIGGQVVRSEWRMRRKDGSFFIGEVVGRQLPDGRLQGILRDITERKQAEERLRFLHEVDEAILAAHSAEEVAQAVVQHAPRLLPCQRAGVVLHHLETRELSLLASYQRNGHSSLGTGWRGPADPAWDPVLEKLMRGEDYVVEDLQAMPPSSPLMAQLQAEGVRAHVYEPIMIRDQFVGTLNLGLDVPGPLPAEQREVVHELAVQLAVGLEQARLHEEVQRHAAGLEQLVHQRTVELSERTAALEVSEARFHSIFDQAAVGIALVSLEGRVVSTNPALQRLTGYSEQELQGLPLSKLLPPGQGDCSEPFHALVTGQCGACTLEQGYVRKGGKVGQANLVVSLLRRDADQPPLVLVLAEDVTERKRAQEALIQAERMAIMGRMAASLAHEVNNPIQSVVGCLGLAMELLEGGEDASPFMNVAMDELERASRIVRQMRDLSRREEVDKELADVSELLESVVLLTHKQAQNRQVGVTWEAEGDLPPVPMVRDRIQQVFLNLVLNAIDATPPDGDLRIRAVRTEEPHGVRISFADTGVGIPPGEVQRLFEAFHSTKELGLGLGLYVSRDIVQEHGGWIDVQSTVGQGSTFTVWLPAEGG